MEITQDNFHEVPLSDLIESVLYDIDSARKAGLGIDMSAYVQHNLTCTVCLGGAAVLGFLGHGQRALSRLNWMMRSTDGDERLRRLAYFFDNLRAKRSGAMVIRVLEFKLLPRDKVAAIQDTFYAWRHQFPAVFVGLIVSEELTRLKKEIKALVAMLRKQGL